MAQPPFKTDVLQIEPAATGTRTISRDTTSNGLKFIDPAYPAGILLSDLVGLQSLSGVSVVGTTFSTIQDAIDDAAIGGDTPVVVIPSGVYTEDLTISKDIVLVGLGYVKVTNDTATSTITVTEDTDGVPRFVQFRNLTIECTEAGESCVDIDGSNTFATGTVTVVATLVAGDTVTINGNVLTGVAVARTSGSDNFNASLGTVTALAAEIAAAINDTSNSFAVDVSATAALGVVSLEAVTPGVGGNAITLAVATTPGGNMTVSGATLSGGGGINSEVGLTEIAFLGCDLVAAGVGTRQISTTTMNNVRVHGGTWFGSSSTSECVIAQTASFKVFGVEWLNDIQAAYDTGDDQPSIVTSEFVVQNCGALGTVITNYIGAGSVSLLNIPTIGDVTVNGDRALTIMNCEMGDVLIEDTVTARLVNSTYDTLGGAGAPTVAESFILLQDAPIAANASILTFDRDQPDTSYSVSVDCPIAGVVCNVTTKLVSGFTVTYSAAVTGDVFFTVTRKM